MQSTIQGKRPGEPLDIQTEPAIKKRKVQTDEDSSIFKMIPMDRWEDLDKNCVYMHELNIERVFGMHQKTPCFLTIGNYVYEVAIDNIMLNAISINPLQKSELEDSIFYLNNDPCVSVRPFFFESRNVISLLELHLQIRFDYLSPLQTTYDYDELKKRCIVKLTGRVVRKNQRFTIDSQENKITAIIKSCHAVVDVFQHYNPPYALVTDNTDIHFENISVRKVSLVREMVNNQLVHCHFYATLKTPIPLKDFSYRQKTEPSLIIDYNQFSKTVYDCLRFDTIHSGFTKQIEFNDMCFDLTLHEMNTKYPLSKDGTNHKDGVYLNPKTKFSFATSFGQIVFTGGSLAPAKFASFKVIETTVQPTNPWIDKSELEKKIKENQELATLQQFHVETNDGTFLLRLEDAGDLAQKNENINPDVHFQSRWKFLDTSIFNFSLDPSLKLAFIENSNPEVLSEVTIEVTVFDDLKNLDIRRNAEQKKHSYEVLEMDLREAIQKLEPKPIVENQTFEVKIFEQTFTLKAKNFQFKESELHNKISLLGTVNSDTRISFIKNESSHIRIIPKKKNLQADQFIATLNKAGLGAMGTQLEELIHKIVIFQDASFEEDLNLCDMKPPRGVIFYGPPGTGKTTLAKNLANFLGAESENVTFISAPEILQKYVGESEKMIRSYFEKAAAAQKKYGRKSPLHVLIFDEFDSIAYKRSDKNPLWTVSLVNQLLASIDGPTELNNILVVGITNRMDSLDPAVIRPGRFEVHLEFSLPDEEGRYEIFEIHTRNLAQKNTLAKDVDLKALAKATSGFSGADIMGLVKAAYSYRNRRLTKARELEKEERDKLLQVTKLDFSLALIEVIKTKNLDEEKSPPAGMYT